MNIPRTEACRRFLCCCGACGRAIGGSHHHRAAPRTAVPASANPVDRPDGRRRQRIHWPNNCNSGATMNNSKLAVVTGAGSGIGLATAEELARRGFHVLAGVRTQ